MSQVKIGPKSYQDLSSAIEDAKKLGGYVKITVYPSSRSASRKLLEDESRRLNAVRYVIWEFNNHQMSEPESFARIMELVKEG